MKGFSITTPEQVLIRFEFYHDDAPATVKAFAALLPFTRTFKHARSSGQEIWIDDALPLDIIQENASVFTLPGEVVYGPSKPSRVKTVNCMGIYYGEGQGLDSCNIFARVAASDKHLLEKLGQDTWLRGQQELIFNPLY